MPVTENAMLYLKDILVLEMSKLLFDRIHRQKLLMLLLIASVHLCCGVKNASAYDNDEVMPPAAASYFVPVSSAGETLIYFLTSTQIPSTWKTVSPNETVRFKVFVPPGSGLGAIDAEFMTTNDLSYTILTQDIPYCPSPSVRPAQGPVTCAAAGVPTSTDYVFDSDLKLTGSRISVSFADGKSVPSTGEYRYVIFKNKSMWDFTFSANFIVQQVIVDASKYNQWLNVPSISSTPSTQVAGGVLTISAKNGTLGSSCTLNGVTYPVTSGSATAQITIPANTPSTSQTVSCLMSGQATPVTTTVTVTAAPASNFTLATGLASVAAGQSFSISAAGVTISQCTTNNANVTFTGGGSGTASFKVASGAVAGSATLTCTSSDGRASNPLTLSVSATPTFSLTPATAALLPGGSATFSTLVGSIKTCTSYDTSLIPDANVVVGGDGTSVKVTVPASAVTDRQVSIVCLRNQSAETATVTVTVNPLPTEAFSLSAVKLSSLSQTAATFKTQASIAANAYWVALPLQASGLELAQPTITQIMAGQDSTGTVAAFSGGGAIAMEAGKDQTFTLSNLQPDTAYKIFLYVRSASSTTGSVGVVRDLDIATVVAAQPTIIPEKFELSTNTTEPLKSRSMTVTITPASNDTGSGSFYVAAYVPKTTNGIAPGVYFYTNRTTNPWQPFDVAYIPYNQSAEPLQKKTITIPPLDMTGLGGIVIYAGYSYPNSGSNSIVSAAVYTIPSN